MKNSFKIIGLLLIVSLLVAPINARMVNNDFRHSNINSTNTIKNHDLSTNISNTNIDTSLSFNETMQYLTKGNKPSYMIIDGDINDIQSCRFIISEGQPSGYRNIKSIFKYNLHDEIYKPTILYDPEDVVWPTQFLTNCSSMSIDQEAIFILMVRNSQYVSLNGMDISQINKDSDEWNIDFGSNADIGEVFKLLSKCYQIVNNIKMKFDFQMVSYKRQAEESYVHNLIIGKKRGKDVSKYGGCYWPKFFDVSNDDLEIMNIKYQTIKHYIKPTSSNIEKVLLELGDIQLAMKAAILVAGNVPEVGTYIKSSLDWALYGLDCLKQNIAWQKYYLDVEYNKADQMTWDISSEKSYRTEVDNGVMDPTKPTEEQLFAYNNEIDNYKENLDNLTADEYGRIFNYGDLEEVRSKYMVACKVYDDIIETYNMYGLRAPQKYYDYQNKFYTYYGDINNVKAINQNEQKVWSFYQSILDNQYNMLEVCKYKDLNR
ncbi:MAG: hypothetical protein LBB45_02800 [Methanobrevibacter sp.]|nr:hypothetical protein [Candidatus Methanovirga basalitermitum]